MEGIENTIRKMAAAIRDNYVNIEIAERVASRIEDFINSPAYKRAIENESLYRIIENINCIILTEADDAHFRISTRSGYNDSSDGGIERFTPHYVSIRDFQGLNDESTRIHWMRVFAQLQDPVVFDLRGCPGGSPETAYYLLCHLFDDGVPLLELQTRHAEPKIFRSASTIPFYTTNNQIKKYNGRVRVLVNGGTASAAESFAYAVQHRGRGKLFGSKTAGHAHIQFTTQIDNFNLHLPMAKTCDPDTHLDWEGKGLTPDFPVGSAQYIQLIYSEITNYTMTPIDSSA